MSHLADLSVKQPLDYGAIQKVRHSQNDIF